MVKNEFKGNIRITNNKLNKIATPILEIDPPSIKNSTYLQLTVNKLVTIN